MKVVQIVVEEGLLKAVDREVRRAKTNRSALVRTALREHLRRRQVREREDQDRAGYARQPDGELSAWDRVASWPED